MPEIETGSAEQAIAEYLLEHSEFFGRRPEALLALELGHSPGGGATSLVQRHVARLRRSNGKLEARLDDLSGVARHNRKLADSIHRLSLRLLTLGSAAERIERLRVSLRRDFSVDSAALVLFCPVLGDIATAASAGCAAGWLAGARARAEDRRTRAVPFVAGEPGRRGRSAAGFPKRLPMVDGCGPKVLFPMIRQTVDECGRKVVFPRWRSVTSERTGKGMARLQPVFPKKQPSRRDKPLHRRKDVPVVQVARGMPVSATRGRRTRPPSSAA